MGTRGTHRTNYLSQEINELPRSSRRLDVCRETLSPVPEAETGLRHGAGWATLVRRRVEGGTQRARLSPLLYGLRDCLSGSPPILRQAPLRSHPVSVVCPRAKTAGRRTGALWIP